MTASIYSQLRLSSSRDYIAGCIARKGDLAASRGENATNWKNAANWKNEKTPPEVFYAVRPYPRTRSLSSRTTRVTIERGESRAVTGVSLLTSPGITIRFPLSRPS